MLSSLTEAYPRQLARACEIDTQRIWWIMEGHPPKYSQLRALVPLGLVTILETSHGRKFMITEKGRRKARMLAARQERRQGPRQQMRPHSGEKAAEGAPTPVSSFTWTVRPHL